MASVATCTFHDSAGLVGAAHGVDAQLPGDRAAKVPDPGALAGRGRLTASLGLAATLATAAAPLPWRSSVGNRTYALVAPPKGSEEARRTALAAASGFSGLFARRGGGFGAAEAGKELLTVSTNASATSRASALDSGTLHVRILAAHGLPNTDTGILGDVSDPYVVAKLGSVQHRTPTIDNDLNPVWRSQNEFSFSLDGSCGVLELEVMNANVFKDDVLGRASVRVWSLFAGDWHRRRLHLDGGRGTLELEVRLEHAPGAFVAERLGEPPVAPGQEDTSPRSPLRGDGRSGAASSSRPRAMPRQGCIALPQDWDAGAEKDEEPSCSPAARARAGSESSRFDSFAPRGRAASSFTLSPRSGMICAPDDFFEEPTFEVGDPALGPAALWELSSRAYAASRLPEPWPGDAGQGRQELDEVLATADAVTLGQPDSEEDGLLKASGVASPEALLGGGLFSQGSTPAAAKGSASGGAAGILGAFSGSFMSSSGFGSLSTVGSGSSTSGAAGAGTAGAFPALAGTAGSLGTLGGLLPSFGPDSSPLSAASASPFAGGAAPMFSHLGGKPQEAAAVASKASAGATALAQTSAPAAAAALAPVTPAAAAAAAGAAAGATAQPVQKEHAEECARLVSRVAELEASLQAFKKDAQHKDFRLRVKKSINTKVSQISATWNRIRDCTTGLCETLGQHLQGADTAKRQFVECAAAERLADDAEVGIKAQPRAAWPVAQVVVRVFEKFPAIEELFWGFMYKACPYLVPKFDGSHLGRTGPAPGQRRDEPFPDFADRMVSYHRLRLAILITREELGPVWQWLARTLNQRPAPIVAPLLLCALEMAGADAQARYQRQFVKLVAYVDREYMRELEALQGRVRGEEADQLRASLSRLRRWLDDFRGRGRAPPSDGRRIEVAEEAELNPDV